MKKFKVLNSKGEEIRLNPAEQKIAGICQKQVNALGVEVDITTMTQLFKKVSEQKFFEIRPSLYMPIRVGEGQWSRNITTFRSFNIADDFGTGIISAGGSNGRLAVAEAGVDAITVPTKNWAKSIGWTLIELAEASRAGNWDLITSLERSRKRNWDLGIQKIAFVGNADLGLTGLLNIAGITPNTTAITKKLSKMTPTELKTFCSTILGVYRANCAYTTFPTHFVIPESDYLGLAGASSPDFPIKSTLALLLETFRTMTMNDNFQILPCAYAENSVMSDSLFRYSLYNYEEESLRMDIPVDYTSTLANTVDNFSFQNVGYGQFTGVNAYRPKEIMYFTHNVA